MSLFEDNISVRSVCASWLFAWSLLMFLLWLCGWELVWGKWCSPVAALRCCVSHEVNFWPTLIFVRNFIMGLGETQVLGAMKPRLSCPSSYWNMSSEIITLFTLLTSVMPWLDHSPGSSDWPHSREQLQRQRFGFDYADSPCKSKIFHVQIKYSIWL